MTKLTEDERLSHRIRDKIKRVILDYDLINDGDRILIGLFGGKDSLVLVDLLGHRSKIYCPRSEVMVVHIVMMNIPYYSDREYLRSCTERYDLPFIVHETSFDPSTGAHKSPCFLCSWTHRKILFEVAKTHKRDRIALGHHQDNIPETLLMNLTHQGAFRIMPFRLRTDKFDMEVIRPVCLVEERELTQVVAWKEHRKRLRSYPYEPGSSRPGMKELLRNLEAINPETRCSSQENMTNIQEDCLPRKIRWYAECLYDFIVDRV